jgi:hypothetical protein
MTNSQRPFNLWRDPDSDKERAVGRVERPGLLQVHWRTNNRREARLLVEYLNAEWQKGPFTLKSAASR